jgi:hypothetical protein
MIVTFCYNEWPFFGEIFSTKDKYFKIATHFSIIIYFQIILIVNFVEGRYKVINKYISA